LFPNSENKDGLLMDKRLLQHRARVFKALAHPVRLELVDALRTGPVCVCELAARFPVNLPAISKHLSLLRDAGVIQSRRDGTKVIYSLVMPCMLESFSCIDRMLLTQLDALDGLRALVETEPSA
jgi:DNA-binding transcriptional ArsR family regulator